jgi:hypothetical protein
MRVASGPRASFIEAADILGMMPGTRGGGGAMETMAKDKESQERRSDQTMMSLALMMAVGILGIFFYASQFGNLKQFASIAGVGIVMAGASALTFHFPLA